MTHDEKIEYTNTMYEKMLPHTGSYNGQIDLDILNIVFLMLQEFHYNTDLATKLSLSPTYVELIQTMLCEADYAEYGTSPRGCWLTDEGKAWAETVEPYYNYIKEEYKNE